MKNNKFLHNLSFSQRYGYEALPKPMRPEELSEDLRREIWNETRRLLLSFTVSVNSERVLALASAGEFVQRVIGKYVRKPEEEIPTKYTFVERFFRSVILEEKFNKTLDFIERLVNDPNGKTLAKKMSSLFEQHGAAYLLDTTQLPYLFFSCASKEQCDATKIAIETLQDSGMNGASKHLRDASAHINKEQFLDSISDSIMSVESVARVIDPASNRTLGPALNSLEKSGFLKNTVIKAAFEKLYAYTNTEEGIRHAFTKGDSTDVGLYEALFMFGACASFAAYLANKQRQMQPDDDGDS